MRNYLIQNPMIRARNYRLASQQERNPKLYERLMIEEFWEFLSALTLEEKLKEAADLIVVIFGWAEAENVDLSDALERVYHNNFRRMVQDDGNVHFREDGKVLKNPSVEKVDLSDLVRKE